MNAVRKDIPVHQLNLDPENPRLEFGVDDTVTALNEIMYDQGDALVELIRTIATDGLDPSLSFMVMPAGEERYLVLEGNRRISALLLLQNPDRCDGVLTGLQKRKIKKAAANMVEPIETVSCVVYPDRDSADIWIERRHSGPLNGAGLMTWGPREKARYGRRRGRNDPTLDVDEFVRHHAKLTTNQLAKVRDMAFTNIQRMIDDVQVRPLLGIEVVNQRVYTRLGRDEVVKGLRRLVLDNIEGKINSRKMNEAPERLLHVQAYGATDRPSPGAVEGDLVLLAEAPETRRPPVEPSAPEQGAAGDGGVGASGAGDAGDDGSRGGEGGGEGTSQNQEAGGGGTGGGSGDGGGVGAGGAGEGIKGADGAGDGEGSDNAGDGSADSGAGGGGSGEGDGTGGIGGSDKSGEDEGGGNENINAPAANKRTTILPDMSALYVPAPPRMNRIYEELSRVNITRYPNSAGVLFRVFFELSVDSYCDKHSLPTTHTHRGHERHLTLKEKFESVCDHIEAAGGKAAQNNLKAVRLLMSSSDILQGGIEHMHMFVHHMHVTPMPEELRTVGDRAVPFLQAIWPQPAR